LRRILWRSLLSFVLLSKTLPLDGDGQGDGSYLGPPRRCFQGTRAAGDPREGSTSCRQYASAASKWCATSWPRHCLNSRLQQGSISSDN
jgi:hypothetical protein